MAATKKAAPKKQAAPKKTTSSDTSPDVDETPDNAPEVGSLDEVPDNTPSVHVATDDEGVDEGDAPAGYAYVIHPKSGARCLVDAKSVPELEVDGYKPAK